MDPLAFILLGVDVDCNDLPLMERLYNLIRHQLPLFLMHDQMVEQHGGAEHRNVFEELFMGRGTVNNMACEGGERLLRSQSLQRYVPHGTVRRCTLRCNTVLYRMCGDNVVRYGVVLYSKVQEKGGKSTATCFGDLFMGSG